MDAATKPLKAQKGRLMLSVQDLAQRWGIGYDLAWDIMQVLPCVDIAPPGRKYRVLRVSLNAVEQYERQRRIHN